MSCPWGSPAEGGPLGSVCEANLCAWLVEPGNTASNLAYVLAGLWLLRLARNNSQMHWFAYLAFAIALGSSAFHATNLVWGRMADWAAVYGITGVMTALNLRRWMGIDRMAQCAIAIGLPIIMVSPLIVRPEWAVPILVLAMPCCAIELRIALRDWHSIDWRYYLWAWGVGGLAVVAWALDNTPALCNPGRHALSGHMVWHLLSAGFLLLMALYYRQFSASAAQGSHQPMP